MKYTEQDLEEIIINCNQSLQNSSNAIYYAIAAEAYRLLGGYNDALEYCFNALKLEPANTLALSTRAEIYRHRQKYDEALLDCDQVLHHEADNAFILRVRADVYRMQEKLHSALEECNKALKLEPNNPFALRTRAEVHRLLRNIPEAEEDYFKVAQLEPDHPFTLELKEFLFKAGSEKIFENFHINYDELTIYEKEILGHGSFGTVFKGAYKKKEVAIKKLNIKEDDEDKLALREIRTMAKLDSPYIVKLYGVCFKLDTYYLVMEYMANRSLYYFLNRPNTSPIDVANCESIAVDIARGIQYLHSTGMRHRDIKSQNVLLDYELHAKLGDLAFVQINTNTITPTLSERRASHEIGSLAWMAPELFEGEPYSEKSDIYSYGVVVWEMISHQKPLSTIKSGLTISQDLNKQIIGRAITVQRPDPIPAETPQKIAQLIRWCWKKPAAARPSAEQIIEHLTQNSLEEGEFIRLEKEGLENSQLDSSNLLHNSK